LGITGASGAIYAKQIMDFLHQIPFIKMAVVFSANGERVFRHELSDMSFDSYAGMFERYENDDFNAPFASGSSRFDTLIITPCSMGTLGRIAHGISNDLITRTADVMLKERRQLIVAPRETPLNQIHLQNMLQLTAAGGVVCPTCPAFYAFPGTADEVAQTVVNRILRQAGLPHNEEYWGL
jgi:4-hydroxy-3-polyprenylbenzoate decarboxylase